jgi:hypothetical protein
MESQEIIGYPIKISQNSVFNSSYITLVTNKGVLVVKINGHFDSYKHASSFDYRHLLKLFMVKSRHNWIITEFLESAKIYDPSSYKEFVFLASVVKLYNKFFKKIDDNFLPLVMHFANSGIFTMQLTEIEELLERYVL